MPTDIHWITADVVPSYLIDAVRVEMQIWWENSDTRELPLHFISVGGFPNHDLPMSGELQETPALQSCPQLRELLRGIIPQLGRVCLFSPQENITSTYPLYRNAAHPLFYQASAIPLEPNYSLLIETRRAILFQDARKLWEAAPPGKPLAIAPPQLDILPPACFAYYLDTVQTFCYPKLTTEQQKILNTLCDELRHRWQEAYARFANDYAGEWTYQSILNSVHDQLVPLVNSLHKTTPDIELALQIIATQLHLFPPAPRRIDRQVLQKARRRQQFLVNDLQFIPDFDRPLFIISVPRAGSTLLFETLSQFPEIWSTGEENHSLLEDIPGLHPRDHQFSSNRLIAVDATLIIRNAVLQAFTSKLQDRQQQYYLDLPISQRPNKIRFLEKTPKNALRILFFKALFPDARFIYLYRDFFGNVSSLIDGWRSQRFIAYRNIPGFANRHWSFLLIPNWRELHDASLVTIATQQWYYGNQTIQADLQSIPARDWIQINYQDLITNPAFIMRKIADFANLQLDEVIQSRCSQGLPVSRLTLTTPNHDKWRKHQNFFSKQLSSIKEN